MLKKQTKHLNKEKYDSTCNNSFYETQRHTKQESHQNYRHRTVGSVNRRGRVDGFCQENSKHTVLVLKKLSSANLFESFLILQWERAIGIYQYIKRHCTFSNRNANEYTLYMFDCCKEHISKWKSSVSVTDIRHLRDNFLVGLAVSVNFE